jgi:hypothetical protein
VSNSRQKKMHWKYALASVRGTSHEISNLPCQDSSLCKIVTDANGQEILLAVASDGAGSSSMADVASQLSCELFSRQAEDFLGSNAISDINESLVREWISNIVTRLLAQAEESGHPKRAYACTLLAAIVGTNENVFTQVGDGCMVVSADGAPDDYCWVFWPERGPYANSTYFLVDDLLHEHIQYDFVARPLSEVALFTDGIESLALKYSDQQAYLPFFQGIFPGVRRSGDDVRNTSQALESFLNSDRVNERTDDDKTLILATRL